MKETLYLDFFLLFIGLGFFVTMMYLVIKFADRDNDRDYNRKLNEAREFGFENSRLRKEIDIPDQPKN